MEIKSGITEVHSLDLFNPEENDGNFNLQYTVYIENPDGTKVQILETGQISPGMHVQTVTLSQALQVGEYNALVHITPYSISTGQTVNNAEFSCKLIVK